MSSRRLVRSRLGVGASALAVVLGSGAAVLALAAPAQAVQDKVTICHATDSDQNPYVENEPAKSGDVSGHADHTGPLYDASLKKLKVQWGDIIPPFDYVEDGETLHFPGLNWPAGEATWKAHCTPTPPPLSLSVVKANDADGDEAFSGAETAAAAGDDVTFKVTVTNTSAVPVVIDSLTDAIGADVIAFDCVDGSDDSLVGQELAPGASATCTVTLAEYAPDAGTSVTNTVTVVAHQGGDCDLDAEEAAPCTLVEDPDNKVTVSATSTVSTPAAPTPTPTVTVSPSPTPTEDTGGGGTVVTPSESPSPTPSPTDEFTGGGGGVTLPHTGFPTQVLAAVAAGIVLLGAWLTFAGRRRKA